METGRLNNKKILDQTQAISPTAASNIRSGATLVRHQTATSGNINYSGEDDSAKILTGPYDGAYASSSGQHSSKWGHVSPAGSHVGIDGAPGAESLSVVHHSGAGVVIDPDGGVFVSSTSKRGAGIGAPFGDFYISAGGEIVIKGSASISITTSGDLTLDVGGTLNIKCAAYNLITKTQDETVDGSASRSVTNDQSVVIGGINRTTVAGDMREQVSGSRISDVAGSLTTRVDGNNTNDVTGNSSHKIGGDHLLSASGKTDVISGGDTNLDAGADLNARSSAATKISGGSTATLTSDSATTISSDGNTSVNGQATKISGQSTSVHGASVLVNGSTTTIGGSTINLATSTVLGPIPSGSGGSAGAPSIDSASGPDGPQAPSDPAEAQTAEVNDIVDSLTSARKYPEYPGNGVTEGGVNTGISTISHDSTPQAEDVYNEYSAGNQGNANPSYSGGSYDTLPETPVNRDPNISVEDPGIEVPSQYNNASKISKFFTLGDIVNANSSHRIPPGKWNEVVKQHILVATNVLDLVKQQFPDMVITSGYRSNSKNHVTGKAIDFVCESRSMTKHAEMARFVRDNCPVDQVFLERNTSGRTHVHVRVGSGTPTVLTCGDPKCRIKVPGIDVEWLARRM